MPDTCTLCELPLPKSPIEEDAHAFCCTGCLSVYRILEALPPKIEETETEQETRKFHIRIDGMWCPACAEAISLILRRQKGVTKCVVDYATDLAMIEFIPMSTSKEAIETKISALGYTPTPILSDEKRPRAWIRFAVVAFCALNLMMFAYPLYIPGLQEGYEKTFGWLSFTLSLPIITYGAWPLWHRLLLGLRTASFGMETLVLMSISTAFLYSTYHLLHHDPHNIYFDTMGMVLTFVLLGKLLEKRAKFSAKETLFRITRSLPNKGFKRQPDGSFSSVPLKEIAKGDILMARVGEKVVLDGIVSSGEAAVDESVMTGEATPHFKRTGNKLVGGSIVRSGILYYTVTATSEESLLSKIAQLIEHNLGQKRPFGRLVDTITRWFVPAVLLLAVLSGNILRALSVLLIACPCAIGIAVPLAEALLLHRFAKLGALVRNRKALQILAKDPIFVFDKTGTLTEGKFRVIAGLTDLSEHEKSLLKGLVIHSTHPISVAISEVLNVKPYPFDTVREIIGKGIEGSVHGRNYRLGSPIFLGKEATTALTTVFFEDHEMILGDQIRENPPKMKGIILSGDTPQLVSDLVEKLGFLWGKGECDPFEKQEEIEKLKAGGRLVVMVGDGINDAPALTAADVGISVVTASELSSSAADILLTAEHLDALPKLQKLAERGRMIIHQNLMWAFGYNIAGIAFAFSGQLTPLFAAGAMILSSLSVTLNSLRISKTPL